MPKNDHLKALISRAIPTAELLIPPYPTRFPDIEAAKRFIADICLKRDMKYSPIRNLTADDLARVKDSTHFLVAVRAFEKGEFYLDVGMRERGVLRAITSDITRLLPLIVFWLRTFPHVGAAKGYIASVSRLKKFVFTPFEGVGEERYRGWVCFHVAREAWERRKFEVEVGVRGWVRKVEGKGAGKGQVSSFPSAGGEEKGMSLHANLESDISRLIPLITFWPPSFPCLNAARNFVAHCCCEFRFDYTGYRDMPLRKYRNVVNYATARDAFSRGWFRVGALGEGRGERRGERRGEGKWSVVKGKGEELDVELGGVSTRAYGMTEFDGKAVGAAKDLVKMADTSIDVSATVSPAVFQVPWDSFEGLTEAVGKESAAEKKSEADDVVFSPAKDEDPFKDLLEEMRREFILKAALE